MILQWSGGKSNKPAINGEKIIYDERILFLYESAEVQQGKQLKKEGSPSFFLLKNSSNS